MKMCIPTINAEEQFSEVCDHFGSAPYFTIYDFEADTYETANNSDHDHGTCHPMGSLKDTGIDCIICKGLGRRALQKLNDSGMKVFRTNQSMVNDIIESFSESKLEEIDSDNTCRNHRSH